MSTNTQFSPAKRAIIIGMDGASMELVKNVIDWGHAPNMGHLMARGVSRPMLGVFPTLTPPGWTALSTGSWHSTHEVMDFNIRAVGKPLDQTVWGINTGLSQSEYLWNTVERAGRNPILVKWEMSWPPHSDNGNSGRRYGARGIEPSSSCRLSPIRCWKVGTAPNWWSTRPRNARSERTTDRPQHRCSHN